ncbi:hypothetical protein CDV31_016902 [Fusarium ambrosium]|uniref:Uncharacterized protein n=1 Tax=Fusarium ambrosium TaxID=131363 RepID=A0A428RYX9_9HYPO|nr:hypothetical protein CDV31_016902 [Fusarium ambrosium]
MPEANTRLYQSQESIGENSAPSHFISVLAHGLITECNATRAPDNFDASLEAACLETGNSISRRFLLAGFQVWFAYFLALQEGNVGGLDQLSPADLTHVTSQVSHVCLHESVRQLFSHLFQSSRGKKRREWLEGINIQAPISPVSPPSGSRPPKRVRISIHDVAIPGQGEPMANTETTHEQQLSTANTYNNDSGDRRAGSSNFVALYGSIGFDFDLHTQLAWPAASNLGLVFPIYLTSIIVKLNGEAWVRASFANDLAKCELEVFISASETQHVAKQLFDQHITPNGQRRSIRLDNDVLVNFNGKLTLSGSPLEKVDKMLGIHAVEAYQLSPSRAEELNNGQIEITRCLSMEGN